MIVLLMMMIKGKILGKNHKKEVKNRRHDKKNGDDDVKDSKQSKGLGDKGCFICDGPHFARNCPRRLRD